jgi:hypothetical protein
MDWEAIVVLHGSLMRNITQLQEVLQQRDARIAELEAMLGHTNGSKPEVPIVDLSEA